MEDLKRCPFCGNIKDLQVMDENEVEYLCPEDSRYTSKPYYAVICAVNMSHRTKGGCGASGGYESTKELAIEKWNRRTEVVTI